MNAVLARLELLNDLTDSDRAAVTALARSSLLHFDARENILSEGDRPRSTFILIRGWAVRNKSLDDGRRQITALLLPGDAFNINSNLLKEMDHAVTAVTQVTLAELAYSGFESLQRQHPSVAAGLLKQQVIETGIDQEWILNIGQRTSYERIAHLLCEIFWRLHAVGLTESGECDFPLTQTDVSEAVGITLVHVNRMLQQLRTEGLIELRRKRLRILDLTELERRARFNPRYLHLRERR